MVQVKSVQCSPMYRIAPDRAYAVCYALFIYLLNLFLAFLQPKFDPSMDADLAEQDVEEGEPGLPTSTSPAFSRKGSSAGLMSGVFGQQNGGGMAAQEDEFKPFIRRLPEFKVGAEEAEESAGFSQLMRLSSCSSVTVLARCNASNSHFTILHILFRFRHSCREYCSSKGLVVTAELSVLSCPVLASSSHLLAAIDCADDEEADPVRSRVSADRLPLLISNSPSFNRHMIKYRYVVSVVHLIGVVTLLTLSCVLSLAMGSRKDAIRAQITAKTATESSTVTLHQYHPAIYQFNFSPSFVPVTNLTCLTLHIVMTATCSR